MVRGVASVPSSGGTSVELGGLTLLGPADGRIVDEVPAECTVTSIGTATGSDASRRATCLRNGR